MSNQKRSAAPARRSAAVLTLFALAACGLDAAGAATRVPFQQQVALSCSAGYCSANFVHLPANQALDIEHVWCEVFGTATVTRGIIGADPAAPFFSIPLDVGWFRIIGTTRFYNLEVDPGMRVPLGKRLKAIIDYSGPTPGGNCSFTGFKITV